MRGIIYQNRNRGVTVLVEFPSGAIGTAHTDMVTSIMDNTLEILGTDGIITVTGLGDPETTQIRVQSPAVPGAEQKMTVIGDLALTEPTKLPVCRFVELVMDGATTDRSIPGLDMDTGLAVIAMVEAAYESASTGKAVEFRKIW